MSQEAAAAAASCDNVFSFRTNLQPALDKVEGHHCRVCDAAAQDTPKPTQGIVF